MPLPKSARRPSRNCVALSTMYVFTEELAYIRVLSMSNYEHRMGSVKAWVMSHANLMYNMVILRVCFKAQRRQTTESNKTLSDIITFFKTSLL